jgi:hypothetical protein
VIPIISGVIMERRDQVRIACFAPELEALSSLRCRLGSTNGPFLSERATYLPFPRRLTMNLSVR